MGRDTQAWVSEVESRLDGWLHDHRPQFPGAELFLRRATSEAWFSDTLAWILDPRGSHGHGVTFLRAFLGEVARERCAEDDDGQHVYQRRASHLKWGGKKSKGRATSRLRLGNAGVAREYFLSGPLGGAGKARFADLVVLDLDPEDGVMVVIENKLFTTDHPSQLDEMLTVVEDRYGRVKTREYVFLTITGHPPSQACRDGRWLQLSWVGHLRRALEAIEQPHDEVMRFRDAIAWLVTLVDRSTTTLARDLRTAMLAVTAHCLCDDLRHLGKGKRGTWEVVSVGTRAELVHSVYRKRPLRVELLKDAVAVHTQYGGKAQYEKILVSFSVPPDQTRHLIELAARDICYRHFNAEHGHMYWNRQRKHRKNPGVEWAAAESLFQLIWRHRFAVAALLAAQAPLRRTDGPPTVRVG